MCAFSDEGDSRTDRRVSVVDILASDLGVLQGTLEQVEAMRGPEALRDDAEPARGSWFHGSVLIDRVATDAVSDWLQSTEVPALLTRAEGDWSGHVELIDWGGSRVLSVDPWDPQTTSAGQDRIEGLASALTAWAGWATLPVRKAPDANAMMRRLLPFPGAFAFEDMLKQMGFAWDIHQKWWRELPGAIDDPYIGTPNVVGRRRLSRYRQRWVVASTADSFGLWDRSNLDAGPVRHWTRDPEGRGQAESFLFTELAEPILAQTVVDGQRHWCSIDKSQQDGNTARIGVLLHRSAQGGMALIEATDQPRTSHLVAPGRPIEIQHAAAIACELPLPPSGKPLQYEIPDLATTRRVATAALWARKPSDWRDIPDDVEPRLLPTLEWITGELNKPSA